MDRIPLPETVTPALYRRTCLVNPRMSLRGLARLLAYVFYGTARGKESAARHAKTAGGKDEGIP
jgi:hypothetical protein